MTSKTKRTPAVDRTKKMAEAMVTLRQEQGTATQQGLIEHGFSPAEISQLKDAAAARAATMMGAEI